MRLLFTSAAGLLALSAAAAAQAPTPAATCRAIRDFAERLRCLESDTAHDAAAVIRDELACRAPPRAADAFTLLVRRNAIQSLAFRTGNGGPYYRLVRPFTLDGLPIVALFGFDPNGRFPFLRGVRSPERPVFGIVTQAGEDALDRFRFAHSPALHYEPSDSGLPGAQDVACLGLDERPGTGAGRP